MDSNKEALNHHQEARIFKIADLQLPLNCHSNFTLTKNSIAQRPTRLDLIASSSS
uniref:Uncharacterized protein n=2 Tax=Vibrionaceae TaxID=641 RepID=A0A0H3ZX74_ALIFS|nr:hypothetical protein [Vibrio tasmaniensis]AKN38479.1 hypothetical protein [Aliivibrio fischeri]